MKLIDLDALGVGMANPAVFENRAHADGWNSLFTILQQAPVVDAVPVVHGRWMMIEGFPGCSECGCSPAGWEAKPNNPYGFPPYCHACGAKMDGGAEE